MQSRIVIVGWTHYPCEKERPQFAKIPHEVNWHELNRLRGLPRKPPGKSENNDRAYKLIPRSKTASD